MEKLVLKEVSLEYKEQAIEYIEELLKYNSHIAGVSSLPNYLNNYEEWIKIQKENKKVKPSEKLVPGITYFLIRESDNKIIGMYSLRLTLNKNLSIYGGHLGYSIRPTERRKGYNKQGLYLSLIECEKYGIEEMILDCKEWNIGSYKSMEALGGILVSKYEHENELCRKYKINVNESINKYKNIYEINNERKVKL